MATVEDKTSHTYERFAEQRVQIEELIRENPDFKDICQDYGKCVEALSYWSKANKPESPERMAEYRELVSKLESEIVQHLERY